MSIFRREVEPPPAKKTTPPPNPSPRRPTSRDTAPAPSQNSAHIANGTKVVGEITGSSRLVIDGFVEGSVRLENEVVIGSQGKVEGTVVAESVQVGGKVHGNIRGIKKVEVLSSGGLEGDVISPRVVIADGAFLKGKVEMTDDVGTVKGSAPSPKGGASSSKGTAGAGSSSGKSAAVTSRNSSPSTSGSDDAGSRGAASGQDEGAGSSGGGSSHQGRKHVMHGGRKGRGGR